MEYSPRPETLIEFPCDYIFKVFGPGTDGENFPAAVQAAVGSVVPVPLDALKIRSSRGGKYLCVSVLVRLHDFSQVEKIYTALRRIPNLCYLL
jgi:putative lipoic acid-binding regulatory protein